jgi:hypothetical protein
VFGQPVLKKSFFKSLTPWIYLSLAFASLMMLFLIAAIFYLLPPVFFGLDSFLGTLAKLAGKASINFLISSTVETNE